MTGLKFGVVYHTGFFGLDPEQVTGIARHAEQAGFESFFTTEHRGRRADEAIDVLRLLWGGDADGVSFDGEFFSFDRMCSFPKPFGGGTLPIHVGGSSPAAARRAGLRGQGYFPGGMTAGDRAAQLALMRETARDAGRDPGVLEYTRWGNVAMTQGEAAALTADGVTRVVISPTVPDLAGQREELSAFAKLHGLG